MVNNQSEQTKKTAQLTNQSTANNTNQFENASYAGNDGMSDPKKEALKIASAYGLFGLLWILFSDRILLLMVDNLETYSTIQTYKGIIYVLITVVLVFFLVYRRAEVISDYFERLRDTAYTDRLTRLANRTGLLRYADQMIQKKRSFTMVYLDLDNFRYINDTLGHSAGDGFIQLVASDLSQALQNDEFIARLGGDDFGIIIPDYQKKEALQRLEEILSVIKSQWSSQNHHFYVSFSVGMVHYPTSQQSSAELLKRANIAMYKGKQSGKKQIVCFAEGFIKNVNEHIELANRLQEALDQNALSLHYQPVYQLQTKKIIGFEALIRWQEEDGTFISPGLFIPLAEETGQIFAIDKWVFGQVLERQKELESKGYKDLKLGVNLSSKILMNELAFPSLIAYLKGSQATFSNIVVEITETAIIDDLELAIKRISQLQELGLGVALDDFGTGFSSLTHLKILPITILKLDQSFISQLQEGTKDAVIVRSVIEMARDLQLKVIAEGIESPEQLDYLLRYEGLHGQGYALHRPQPFDQVCQLLE